MTGWTKEREKEKYSYYFCTKTTLLIGVRRSERVERKEVANR
jgi:hypothetical protein